MQSTSEGLRGLQLLLCEKVKGFVFSPNLRRTDLFTDGFLVFFLSLCLGLVFWNWTNFSPKKTCHIGRCGIFVHQKKVRKDEASSLRRKLRVSKKMCLVIFFGSSCDASNTLQ